MEKYKLPKNIRQIGDQENWIRVYIEDYVHTYIQKLRDLQENSVAGGILLGKKQRINGIMHLFITGAAVAEDPFWKIPGQTPGQIRGECSVYFPELEVCGFFVSSRQIRTSEVELLRIFEKHFNTEQQVLLDIKGQDEDVYSYSGHSMVRLAGYYIYYEKNEEMQNYILRQESFRTMEDRKNEKAADFSREDELYAAVRSGKGGDRQQKASDRGDSGGKKVDRGRKKEHVIRQDQGKVAKKVKNGKWYTGDMVVRMASIAGIFVLAFLLFSDQVHLRKLNTPLDQNSGISSISEQKGNIKEDRINTPEVIQAGGSAGETEDGRSDDNKDKDSSKQEDEKQQIADNDISGKNESETAYKPGVQSVSGAIINSGSDAGNLSIQESRSIGEIEAPSAESSEQSGETENVSSDAGTPASTHVFPMKYLVKKGDSLYAISEKYYGTIEMVDAICLENNITDPEKVNYGVVLTLPVRQTN